uniref:Uncharacterized protein n=1 Tax=Arundo donax TaxID=35708 RepID=A0A0A9D4Z4_ARUDO
MMKIWMWKWKLMIIMLKSRCIQVLYLIRSILHQNR